MYGSMASLAKTTAATSSSSVLLLGVAQHDFMRLGCLS